MAQDFGDDMGNALLNFVTRQTENYLRFGRGRERAFDWWQRHYKKEGNTPEQQKAMVTETKERYHAQIKSVYRKYRKEIRGMEGMEIVDIPKLKLPRPDSDIADDSEVKRLILACWRGADELRAEVSSTVMPKGKKNGGNAGSGGSQRAQQAPAQERPEPNKENGER